MSDGEPGIRQALQEAKHHFCNKNYAAQVVRQKVRLLSLVCTVGRHLRAKHCFEGLTCALSLGFARAVK